ncbi:MAG: histidine--tRNA ligase [Ignavibacteria bacterium GWF2_33_9]|nr:MAG: histidine--tRNA ligase [Ignavibacteria bacterium GWF2_33_9]
MEKIPGIRGTKDILPNTIDQWHFLFDNFNKISNQFGYSELRTPIFEKTEVFHRSIGEQTDIVNKEMYTFTDKGGESITLRPEETAALVRSVIQNSLLHENNILRLWYFGPYFRYERPQKGRLRQFHQYGAELIGSPNPEADAESIQLAVALAKSVGITDYKLLLNSLGNDASRQKYRAELVNYLEQNKNSLSFESQNRMMTNPLRVLDSKDEGDIELLKNAPVILDSLDSDSITHFNLLTSILNDVGIGYEISNQLVRGLDYYSHSVFEFRSTMLGSQDSFGGGGRYDGLFTQLGGKETPAVGFAFGLERILLILEAAQKLPLFEKNVDFFVVIQNSEYLNFANKVMQILRNKGYSVISELSRRSFKAQMRDANKSNAKFACIIGESEFNNNKIAVKNLATSEQKEIPFNEITNLNL